MPFTCTKTFDCVSTAHRNWRAASNTNRDSKKCSLIHGYTKTFTFVFGCEELDEFQWVYDYGTTSTGKERTMTKLKNFINNDLDHGVTTDSDDPKLSLLEEMHDNELIKLIVIPVENGASGSVEGLCRYIYNVFDPQLREETNGRVWIESVTISEHHKNSSTFTKSNEKFIANKPQSFDKNWILTNFPDLTTNEATKCYDHLNITVADELEKNGLLRDVSSEETKKSFVQFDSQNKDEKKKNSAEEFLEKHLTKENITAALKLLSMHPKYKVMASSLLVASSFLKDNIMDNKDQIKELLLKNPAIIELLQKGMK